MKIRELYLKNFGKFSNERIILNDGINLFYGDNESGKTTIHTFIRSMLFGLERGRGRASANDTFSLYEPWENPNYYSGVLRFESGGKNFCLTRNFDKYGKSALLVCEDDGEEFSLEHGDLEILLNGLKASNYDNTIAIGQMKVEINQSLAVELQNYATNYYSTGNSDVDLDGALAEIRNKKKGVEKNIRELLEEKEEKIRVIEQEKGFVRREIEHLEQEIEELDKQIGEMKSAEEESEEGKTRSHGAVVLMLALLVSVIIAVAVLDVSPVLFAVVAAAYVVIELIRRRKRRRPENIDEGQSDYTKLLWEREHLQENLKEKEIMFSNLQEQQEEFGEADNTYQSQVKMRKALDMTIERIESLAKDVHHELSHQLNEKASTILAEITGGKYERLFVDDKLKMSLYAEGRKISIEQVSRGTIEQIYFSLRMSASDILYEEEYPVILDETFVYYDDKRLENTLRWLKKNKKQILIFTCQKREQEILNKIS